MTGRRPQPGRRGRPGPREVGRTSAERDRAARQREVDRALRVWTPSRVLGWFLVAAAVVVGVVHWLAHIGWRPIPLPMPTQDLFLGYPAAGLVAFAAALILGQNRRPS